MDLKEAADRLGVHYQTAYRWVRNGSLTATKIGTSYRVNEPDIAHFLVHRATPTPPPRQSTVRDWNLQAARLYGYLVAGDEVAARALVDRFVAGCHPPLVLCERLFTPALSRIGDEWAAGKLTVAHEHRAAAMCDRLLARIAVHPRGRPRGVAVVCTPPGEQHGLPATMAAVVLRADRWQVHHLGTQVPCDDLLAMVDAVAADLVVVSPTMPTSQARAAELAAAVGCRALVGGPGRSLQALVDAARS